MTNPQIRQIKLSQPKLRGIYHPEEENKQKDMEVDLLLGQKDYARIRKETPLVKGVLAIQKELAGYMQQRRQVQRL